MNRIKPRDSAAFAEVVSMHPQLKLRRDAPARFVLEPGAFEVHTRTAESGVVSHAGYVESFPGPYPFISDATTSA